MIAVSQLNNGETAGYIRSTAGLTWGAMVLIFGFSHAAMLTTIPVEANAIAGPVGWFVYLVILTETNDIAQALVGRRFGSSKRHRIAPQVSPNKTWEGFLGGMLATVLLSAALSPLLTPLGDMPIRLGFIEWRLPFFWPVVAGVLIAISGFFGDINMSAVKRDAGVKDSSALLPGMGGVIDRVDSLTFAAPVFYYLVRGLIQ
jgi:phosphatidate cytidylyltransferase